MPPHMSMASQTPAAVRHTVVMGSKASAGQLPAPSQFSAMSQAPASARHSTLAAAKLSRQPPAPSQESGALQVVLVASPQLAPAVSS